MARATSKAWISATQQIPSTEHLHRMTHAARADLRRASSGISPQAMFPGAGGMPVLDDDGVVVGGIAASGATVSPFLPAGVAPEVVSAEGEPANPEDLLIAYALGVPYVGQHGDDRARWEARFGDLVVAPEDSLGMKPAPGRVAPARARLGARGLRPRHRRGAAPRGARVRRRRRPRGRPDPAGPDGRRRRRRPSTSRSRPLPPRRASAARATSSTRSTAPAVKSLGRLQPGAVPRRARRCARSSSTAASSAVSVSAAPTRRSAPSSPARSPRRERRAVRVAVLGCGAIGSLYAAHLARVPGVEVWAVDPWAEHMAAIEARRAARDRARRLRRSGARASPTRRTCRRATSASSRRRRTHTRAAVAAARDALPTRAVVSVQNGVGNEEVIAELVPRVVRGSIVPAGHVTEPGVVTLRRPRRHLARAVRAEPRRRWTRSPRSPSCSPTAGCPTHALDDARGPQWTKVVFNAATSPLAALTGLTVGQVCTDPALREQVDAAHRRGAGRLRGGRDHAAARPAALGRGGDREGLLAQAIDAAGRPGARGSPRSTCSTAASPPRAAASASPTPGHDAMVALVHGLESSWT